jgi:cytoskeletal protein CcmA (bactofilin family)
LSSKSNSASYAQSRTDTLIGAGLRVQGSITFTGVLRILGNVRGDVCCDTDANGSAIVGRTGQVDGAINAPYIVVGGRVDGPLQASESIEIQRDGCVVGDASFKGIAIHAGGVIEGVLAPRDFADSIGSALEHRGQILEPPAPVETVTSRVHERVNPAVNIVPAGSRFGERLGRGLKLGGAIFLLLAVGVFVLVNGDSQRVVAPVAEQAPQVVAAEREVAAAVQAPQPAPAASVAVLAAPVAVAEKSAPVAPNAILETSRVVKVAPATGAEADLEKVFVVQGDSPDKSASAVFVIAKEPAVLFKKKRQDSGEGTRIELSQSSKKTLAVATDEILRVAEGRSIELYYQGRRVAPNAIASGTWMRFLPRSSFGGGVGETN